MEEQEQVVSMELITIRFKCFEYASMAFPDATIRERMNIAEDIFKFCYTVGFGDKRDYLADMKKTISEEEFRKEYLGEPAVRNEGGEIDEV